MDTIKAYFSEIKVLFSIFKKKKEKVRPPHSPLVACLWMWLSMHQHPWISLNISLKVLEQNVLTLPGLWICLITLHVRQAFEDGSGSKMCQSSDMAWLYVQRLRRVLNMSEYGSIYLNTAWICLNILASLNIFQHVCNVPEYAWKYLNKLFWLCQGPQCASSS